LSEFYNIRLHLYQIKTLDFIYLFSLGYFGHGFKKFD